MGSLKGGLRPPLEIPENYTQYTKKRAAPPKAARFFFNDISFFVRYDIFLAENDITPYLNANTAYVTPLSFSDAIPLPSVGAVWVCSTVTCAVESVTPRLFWPPAAMPAYCFVQPVIACENGVRATTQLREAVLKHLDEAQRDWCEQYVGFPDCSVDRIVPPVKSENPIDVVVERFFEWNVERAAFKGAVPEIPGMNPADNLIAYIERKLFTLNTGHAITAYLGRMKGYMTICQSISDEHIHTIVKAAMRESGRGLVALYGFDRDAHFAYIDKIIGRFRNPYLCDDVTRVGREPLRKLSAGDRLVKPILTARRYGIATPDLLLGVGAALHYDNPEDVQSVEMRRLVIKEGVKAALARIASLPDTDPLLPLAAQAYEEVERIIAKIPEAQ